MAKKKTSGKLTAGTTVRVKEGVLMPDFPDVHCSGWTGCVVEPTGKKPKLKYVIEWDDSIVEAMPADYVAKCEEKQFFYRMACFGSDDLETISTV